MTVYCVQGSRSIAEIRLAYVSLRSVVANVKLHQDPRGATCLFTPRGYRHGKTFEYQRSTLSTARHGLTIGSQLHGHNRMHTYRELLSH